MEPPEYSIYSVSTTTSLEVLAASLAMRLSTDELEWLCRDLKERAEKRRGEPTASQLPMLANYRDVWEVVGDDV